MSKQNEIEKITPLMQQYQRIKKKYPSSFLLFRLGDFYELFGEDAIQASPILQITLTSRNKVPMCGVPFHAAANYIAKLIKAGKKVAICEQVSLPSAGKELVKREVIRVITPGTLLEESFLEGKINNFLASIYIRDKKCALGLVDVSTGDFLVTEFEGDIYRQLSTELVHQPINEILLPQSYKEDKEINSLLQVNNIMITFYDDFHFIYENASEKLLKYLGGQSLRSFGLENNPLAVICAGALINYLEENEKVSLRHIKKIRLYNPGQFMIIDENTKVNLELVTNLINGTKKNTLLDVVDFTQTSAGGRKLRQLILQPLLDKQEIENNLDYVEIFYSHHQERKEIRQLLTQFLDLERIISRLNCNLGNARDLVGLEKSLSILPELNKILLSIKEEKINLLVEKIPLQDYLVNLIKKAIVDEPPAGIREGGMIKPEFDEELHKVYLASKKGKQWIRELEIKEKKRTGINSLKVGYTSVFGYYIEVSKANLKFVPPDYIRKQTLVNSERFVTPQLKEIEDTILHAEERKIELEYQIFNKIKEEVLKYIPQLQEIAYQISLIDVFISLAQAAIENNYIRPKIDSSFEIIIKEGRHPVVEKIMEAEPFVPNDTYIDTQDSQILIITGPNMSGKSTYLRQVALIIILAQIGSFVPAIEAKIGIVDRIFTRIGARDILSQGASTFMVEMMETANILNNATPRSLLILDEVGRGTSTFDGISIAWATVEYLAKRKSKTLFATHFFELTGLEKDYPNIKNYNFAVKEWQNKVIFLRKLIPGAADKSYGIQVAHLAGLPKEVLKRAEEILLKLENENIHFAKESNQLDIFSLSQPVDKSQKIKEEIYQILEKISIQDLTPLEALNLLAKLKELIENGKDKDITS